MKSPRLIHLLGLLSLVISQLSASAQTISEARITEFLSSNQDGIEDSDGETSDWIEIWNASGVAGDLGGWHLTDDPANLTKWTFPSGTNLQSDAYRVVFASGKDRIDPATDLHTNFKLGSAAGSYLALVKPDGVTIADEFASYPEQFSDIAYGSEFGSAVPLDLVDGYFADPTPGVANTFRYDGITADTSFSTDRGFYDASFNLEITTTTAGAEIRYTTDGTPPTETSGLVYSVPISVSETSVIRAMAHRPGFRSTNVDTHTYIFPENVYGPSFVDSLTAVPTISLVTQANHELQFASVGSTAQLPAQQEKSEVIVALVGGNLHIRVVDVKGRRNQETNTISRQTVLDKSEAQLVAGQDLTDLKNLFNAGLPDASNMSPEARRQIIDKALAVAEFSPIKPFQDGQNDYLEHKCSIEMIYPDGTSGFQEDAGLTNFGGGFTNFAKKSFRVYFRGEYGAKKLRHPIFNGFESGNFPPVEEFDAINLRSGSHDMTNRGAYMSTRFADDSMLEMGNVAPHGRFLHVYLDGDYWGQYHLRERWNADMASSYFGGSKDDYDAISANNAGSEFQDGSAYDGTDAFWDQTESLLQGANPFVNAADHMDIANLIDFMLLWTSGECESEFRAFGSQSRGVPFKFMVRDPDGFLSNNSWSRNYAVTHNGPLSGMTELRTSGSSDYDIFLADRIHKHFFNGGAMTAESSIERLRKRYEEMLPGFEAEAERWNYQTVASWETFVNGWLDTRMALRSESMMQKLRAAGMYPDIVAPLYSQHGGSVAPGAGVTMRTNVTAIYYTLDGSDPRLPGGAINQDAVQATFSNGPPEPMDFVVTGDDWKYLDDGSDQGAAWRASAFDDTGWEEGPSELGYNEGDEATLVDFVDVDPVASGTQRNATTYFRRKVTLSEPGAYSWFVISMKYDDGAAIYINGSEAVRTANLPADAAFDTYANGSTPNERTYFDFIVPTSLFIDGENTIAVEMHNSSAGSSDISFDLILRGEVDTTNGNNITTPVVLSDAALLNARAYDISNGEWSALNSAFFSLNSVPAAVGNFVVSEFNYHPAEPVTPAETAISTDRDSFEFLELLNTSAQPIELGGVAFTDGITYTFPDNTILDTGARAVLVSNLEAFTARYGALPAGTIVGDYSGRLNNDGERVAIAGQSGTLLEFTYNDQLPWPTLPDGQGYTMVLVDPQSNPDHNDSASWLSGATLGGGPGETDGTADSGYLAWKSTNNVGDDLGDDDSDRIFNLAEYGLGALPGVPDSELLPDSSVMEVGGQEYLTITFQKNLLATDIEFEVQYSTDLATWVSGGAVVFVSETANPDGLTADAVWRSASPIGTNDDEFLRLQFRLLSGG